MSIHRLKSKKLDGFNHGFFTRRGGICKGIYKGLNCGTGSKDDHFKVQFNRELVASEMNITTKELITVYQEHSAKVVIVDSPLEILTRADAIVTNTPNLSISVLTADCLPVLFADKKNNVVGAAHAGWKGALGGVLENTVQLMTEIGADIRNIEAVIGPCISPINYEVAYSRGINPGEHIVNLHLYREDLSSFNPFEAQVVVTVVHPKTKIRQQILESTVLLDEIGKELTIFRFKLDEDGNLNKNSLNNDFVQLRSGSK